MNIEPTHELEKFDVEEDVSAAELVLFSAQVLVETKSDDVEERRFSQLAEKDK